MARGATSHQIPFIVKLNHNEFLHYPNTYDQVMFASVRRPSTSARSASAPPSTSARQSRTASSSRSPRRSPRRTGSGMFTVLWCYLRNPAFKKDGVDYHVSADLTGQANHLGVTIEADIIKQKQPENNGGYNALGFGKTDPLVYDELTTDHPIDLTRWQVVNCYAGRIGLINSGGESKGDSDLAQAVRTAVINKRAGGTGPDRRPQGVPAPDGRGRRADPRHPGRVPGPRGHHRLTASPRRPSSARGAGVGRLMRAAGSLPDARRPSGLAQRGAVTESDGTGGRSADGADRARDRRPRDDGTDRHPSSSTGWSSGSPGTPATACS